MFHYYLKYHFLSEVASVPKFWRIHRPSNSQIAYPVNVFQNPLL